MKQLYTGRRTVYQRRRTGGGAAQTMQGGVVMGVFVGLVLGLLVALGVAWFVNKAALPFNKGRDAERPVAATPAQAPAAPAGSGNIAALDPARQGTPTSPPPASAVFDAKGADSKAPAVEEPKPAPVEALTDEEKARRDAEAKIKLEDAKRKLEEAKAKQEEAKRAKAEAEAKSGTKDEAKTDVDKAKAKAEGGWEAGSAYVLQVGSFQNPNDADNLKAKLALMGIEATVSEVTLAEKGVMHRVRVGPFSKPEDMNRARVALAQNGIGTSLIKTR